MPEYVVMPKADYVDACDAAREKTGGTEAIKSGELGEMIRGIESGGGLERTAWYRPPDWPDITSLPLSTTNRQAYYTIDKGLPGAGDTVDVTAVGYKNSTVELGYIDDGEFVVVRTYDNSGVYLVTHSVDLTAVENRFPVIRVTHTFALDADYKDWRYTFDVAAPVIEMYFNGSWTPGYTNIASSTIGCANLKAITAAGGYDFSSNGLSYRAFGKGLEMLDVSKCTTMNADTLSRALYSMFQNSVSLKVVEFPAVEKNSVILDAASQSSWPRYAFQNCYALVGLDLSIFETSEVTALTQMFDFCYSMRKLDISGWNLSACTDMTNVFRGCQSLVELITDGATMPAVSFSLSDSALLSVDSLVGVIAALPTLEEGTTATLTLGGTNTAKLTEEQLAVATEKGWTVA